MEAEGWPRRPARAHGRIGPAAVVVGVGPGGVHDADGRRGLPRLGVGVGLISTPPRIFHRLLSI
jgi:hypothetical protein